MIVREVMTPDPYAVNVTTSIRQVLAALLIADVRHVPVVDEGALVGIVSDRDLRSVMPTVLEQFEQPEQARRILAQPVTAVMDSGVISVHPETDLADVIDLMVEHRIGAVPVVEADSLKLIGIVSYVDVLNAARDSL